MIESTIFRFFSIQIKKSGGMTIPCKTILQEQWIEAVRPEGLDVAKLEFLNFKGLPLWQAFSLVLCVTGRLRFANDFTGI